MNEQLGLKSHVLLALRIVGSFSVALLTERSVQLVQDAELQNRGAPRAPEVHARAAVGTR